MFFITAEKFFSKMGHRLCVLLAKARFVGRIQNTLEAQEAVRDADPVVVTHRLKCARRKRED